MGRFFIAHILLSLPNSVLNGPLITYPQAHFTPFDQIPQIQVFDLWLDRREGFVFYGLSQSPEFFATEFGEKIRLRTK